MGNEITSSGFKQIEILEKLTALSVDLHNLNAGVQRRWHLSIVQWLVLRKIVEMPGLSAGTIAEYSKVHPSTLTPTLNRLAGMGLIYIMERTSDQRRKFIVASRKGLEWSQRSETALSSALREVVSAHSSAGDEIDETRALTARINQYIQEKERT